MDGASVLERLSDVAVYLPWIPVVTGGLLERLKPFMPDERSIGDRMDLLEQTLAEKVTCSHLPLLTSAQPPRGDPPQSHDILGKYTLELIGAIRTCRELDLIRKHVRRCYSALLFTIFAGVGLLIVAALFDASRTAVAFSSIGLVAIQACLAWSIRGRGQRALLYERVS